MDRKRDTFTVDGAYLRQRARVALLSFLSQFRAVYESATGKPWPVVDPD